jgi:glycosyltransferase involved in cell wall biosynthesis
VPSIEPEAFGRSAVEAQAMGLPVVVTDIGAAPETVLAPPQASEAERTGWRVPPDDASALADAIARTLALGASQREALASRARRHVESHFSVETMCARTLSVYSEVFSTRRAEARPTQS